MNNILKKLSILTVLFVFLGTSSLVVSATEISQNVQTTQIQSANNSVTLSEDEYNNLLKRIEELEQLTQLEELSPDKINQNLLDYYEKTKADRETNISMLSAFLAMAITVLLGVVGVVIGINYTEGRNASEKAEQTNKKAEKANKKAEKKLSELDETKIKLDLYIEKAKAQTTNDFDLSIEIYNEVINKMQELKLEDEYIFYERGNTYLTKFRQLAGIIDNYKRDIDIEIENLENIEENPYLIEEYSYLLDNAIMDFKKFLEKDCTDSLYNTTKFKLAECLIYKKEYEKAFINLNDVKDSKVTKFQPIYKVIALIIIYPDLYKSFSQCIEDDSRLFIYISGVVKLHRSLIFERIFANELIFNTSLTVIEKRSEEEFEKHKNDSYNELMEKLDTAYKTYNELILREMYDDITEDLEYILYDFNRLTQIKSGKINIKDAEFFVFNNSCILFLLDLKLDKYNELLAKVEEINNSLLNI